MSPIRKSEIETAVEDISRELSTPPAELLERLTRGASPDCLRPEELEVFDQLPSSRQQHLNECAYCRRLFDGMSPDLQKARVFAANAVAAVSFREDRPRTRWSRMLSFLRRGSARDEVREFTTLGERLDEEQIR
jgi:hypothetical protein